MHYKIEIPLKLEIWSSECRNDDHAVEKAYKVLTDFLRAQGFAPTKLEFGKTKWEGPLFDIIDSGDNDIIDTEGEDNE